MPKGLPNRNPAARQKARGLRSSASAGEHALWQELRRKRLGVRFRRQYPIGPYVLDFYCPSRWLCVEVDGDFHDGRQERDATRDAFLAKMGVRTLRFWSTEVLNDAKAVAQSIWLACQETADVCAD
ncbi:MAG: DUF559 domain-containing protein [Armatimonadetes bacterium]|nr:DUF559 domain-containing protein [Armatimonadota bacterium]